MSYATTAHQAARALLASTDRKVVAVRDYLLAKIESGDFSWMPEGYNDFVLEDSNTPYGIGGRKASVMRVQFPNGDKRAEEARILTERVVLRMEDEQAEGWLSAKLAHMTAQELLNELRDLDRLAGANGFFGLGTPQQAAHMQLRAEALSRMGD